MKNALKSLILLLVILSPDLSAQDTIIDGKRYKQIEESVTRRGKHIAPLDSQFVIGDKKLKYYNNWLTFGAGAQQNLSYTYPLGFTGGLDYNFHIKHHYFQLGTLISGEKFGFYNNYQFHLGYGVRKENRDFHYAGFAGVSYSTGYGRVDSVYIRKYDQPGFYLQAEMVKKVTYDVGIGAAFYFDWSPEQAMVGLRAILYFSGAYKGSKSGKRNDD